MAKNKIVAFDIGIKNLAYCVFDPSTRAILALENATLIEDVEPILCSNTTCKNKATVMVEQIVYCRRHCPKSHRILPALLTKKRPPHRVLKELIAEQELHGPTHTVNACMTLLATRCALPVYQPKSKPTAALSLETLHDALRTFVHDRWMSVFNECRCVLLENQPVLKNPHMKSVQVLLFATLRERYLSAAQRPVFRLVHAAKKTRDVQTDAGDKGYTQRKQASEEAVRKAFAEGAIVGESWRVRWEEAKKKSDMADAICMALQQAEEEEKSAPSSFIDDAHGL